MEENRKYLQNILLEVAFNAEKEHMLSSVLLFPSFPIKICYVALPPHVRKQSYQDSTLIP